LTSDVSEDIIIFGFTVDFSNAGVLVRIRSIPPNYQWMTRGDDQPPQDTPINAIAGIFSQASPILQLVQPFFLKKQSRLEMQFTNSAAGATTGGLITARGLRLTNPYNGFGWDYDIGFKP
jgi:hypothetical protein